MSAPEAPNFQAYLDRVEGRSVIRMARRDWESAMGRTGEPVALDVTQTPLGRVAPKVVAAVAEPHAPGISRIEIYRYDAKDAPTPINVDRFLVLEDPTVRWDVGTIVVSASTEDNFNLRDYLRHYVFLVKEDRGPDHWLPALPGKILSVIRRP
jgi:hypothetical protein